MAEYRKAAYEEELPEHTTGTWLILDAAHAGLGGDTGWTKNIHPEYRVQGDLSTPELQETLTPVYPTTEGIKQATLRKLTDQALASQTSALAHSLKGLYGNEAQWTGGPDGMPVPAMGLFGFELTNDKQWYWVVAILLSVSVWASLNLIDSPFGRALRALHGSEVASQVVGVDVVRYKVAIFVLSAVLASLMGSVTAHYVGFVSPNFADFFHSIELVTMVVIGGMASVYGSLVGAVLLTALPQALATFEGWETVVFGAILMGAMIFLPKGLVPTLAAKFGKGE